MPTEALIRADVDGLRLLDHARSAPLAAVASLAVMLLLLWLLHTSADTLHLLAWLPALGLAIGCRLLLPWAQQRALPLPCAAPQLPGAAQLAAQARWLRRYRLSVAAHGLAWGVAAWLPASLADPQLQASLTLVLVGMVVGAMALTLFDLVAAWLFAALVLVPLAMRLAGMAEPLAPATLVACALAGLLLAMLSLAGRRVNQERRALARTQRVEHHSAQAARDAQALLQQVFGHAGLGISVFDRDLRLVAWNSDVAGLTGLPPLLLRPGLPLADALRALAEQGQFGPVDVASEVARRLAVLQRSTSGVERVRRPDGRMIEVRRNPLPGGGMVLFHVDITEREAARRAAAEQQRMLALVLARTEQGFWYIDNELRTTDANPAMCRMLGLERRHLLGRSIYDFVDAENRAVFERNVALRAAGQVGGYEVSLSRADGSQVHCFNNATPVFDAAGRKTGALGLFSDISAQKAAELQIRQAGEELAQKSQVLVSTLDSLVQGVLNVDPQGRCTAWNRRFLELLQLPPSLMAGRPQLNDLLAWQLAQDALGNGLELLDADGRASISRAQGGAPPGSGHRYRRVRPDGTVLDVASHFAADGSLVRTFTDVTASVAAEAALIAARDEAERAREEAEAANRAKSDFLSRMSHELRTPLNAILGFAQLLQADRDDPPSALQRQRLDELVRGGHHLLALINDVLDVARIEGGKLQLTLEPVDLPQLVQEALALVQPVAQARGVLLLPPALESAGRVDSVPGWRVTADATRLRQVLLNLLSNAIKFNRAGGEVRVAVRDAGSLLRVDVADQGAGIPAGHLPRLFQAFERLDMDGAVEGTGIGLALSRSLVTLMQGEIGVHSMPGQGSVFWLQLPRSSAALPGPDSAAPAAPQLAPAGRHDVLYIEDNEVNQLLMQGMLAHRPAIDLRLAALPETGLAMAVAQPPDLVLLDIQLPGIDGHEVLRRLRQHTALQHTPVIAVSANAMPDDLEQARAAGFSGYLTKPLDMQRLLAAVDQALAA
jgi:PAS domain S-box-containing protein